MGQIDKIIEGYKEYSSDADAISRINLAFEIARDAHAGQFRKSGEPYIVHPLAVATILVKLKMDSACICAALLHDTIEDTDIEMDDIRKQLGREIAGMVDSLTKIKTNALAAKLQKEHARAETMRKIVLGMAKNVRVIIIKLADRWNNIQTLSYLPAKKQKQIARETMTIYAPIADRLGLSVIRRDLQDLSFSYLDPKNYQTFQRRLAMSRSFLSNDVDQLKREVKQTLDRHGMEVEIYERFKTPYGLFQRNQQGLPAHFLHLNLLTNSSLSCYQTLGILHQNFKPLPGTTIKDYIAIPRTNGYQALHTYILWRENVYPIQIRTTNMEQIALHGILQTGHESSRSRYRGWIKRLKEWVQDESDARYMLKGIEDLAAQDKIYVCTPQGDYLGFPRGAIVLDFAYRIHTDIGHSCQGALIDERPVGIFEELQDGTMVEIVHSDEIQVQPGWINHVKTPRSRSAIGNWLESKKRIRSREFGQQLIKIELDRLKLNLEEIEQSDGFKDALEALGAADAQDLYFKLGRGIITLKNALKSILNPEELKRYQKRGMSQVSRIFNYVFKRHDESQVFHIRNIHDPYLKYSKCCNPLPGEEIIGVLSIQHGLSVHKADCPLLKTRKDNEERIIRLAWKSNDEQRETPLTIKITCQKKPGITSGILQLLENHSVRLRHLEMIPENTNLVMTLEIITNSAEYSDRILGIIKKHKGVVKVQTINKSQEGLIKSEKSATE